MFAKYLHQAAFVAFFSSTVLGQDSVPSDLSAGFATSGVELQASFTNDAVDGIKDGTTFEKDGASPGSDMAQLELISISRQGGSYIRTRRQLRHLDSTTFHCHHGRYDM